MTKLTSDQELSIKFTAESLEENESAYRMCPICYGGVNKDVNTFSVTKIDVGILYHCFRDSCQAKGIITDVLVQKSLPLGEDKPSPASTTKWYVGALDPLPSKIKEDFCFKYNLAVSDLDTMQVRYAPAVHRLHFPIFGKSGERVGELLRRIDETSSSGPKAILYKWREHIPSLYYARPVPGDSAPLRGVVILTEDIISAQKVTWLGRSVALLGTSLNLRGLMQIANSVPAPRTLIIALDADTWTKTVNSGVKIKNRAGVLFDHIDVLRVTKDPKDMNSSEMLETFERYLKL